VDLALNNDGEIISADSRQVYKGLDIGTGKITPEEMKGIPHHMLGRSNVVMNSLSPSMLVRAKPIVEDIFARGKTRLFVAALDNILMRLSTMWKLHPFRRIKLTPRTREKKMLMNSIMNLHKKDPHRADDVDRYNKVRLIRHSRSWPSLDTFHRFTSRSLYTKPKCTS